MKEWVEVAATAGESARLCKDCHETKDIREFVSVNGNHLCLMCADCREIRRARRMKRTMRNKQKIEAYTAMTNGVQSSQDTMASQSTQGMMVNASLQGMMVNQSPQDMMVHPPLRGMMVNQSTQGMIMNQFPGMMMHPSHNMMIQPHQPMMMMPPVTSGSYYDPMSYFNMSINTPWTPEPTESVIEAQSSPEVASDILHLEPASDSSDRLKLQHFFCPSCGIARSNKLNYDGICIYCMEEEQKYCYFGNHEVDRGQFYTRRGEEQVRCNECRGGDDSEESESESGSEHESVKKLESEDESEKESESESESEEESESEDESDESESDTGIDEKPEKACVQASGEVQRREQLEVNICESQPMQGVVEVKPSSSTNPNHEIDQVEFTQEPCNDTTATTQIEHLPKRLEMCDPQPMQGVVEVQASSSTDPNHEIDQVEITQKPCNDTTATTQIEHLPEQLETCESQPMEGVVEMNTSSSTDRGDKIDQVGIKQEPTDEIFDITQFDSFPVTVVNGRQVSGPFIIGSDSD
ncbi:hypothetical protein N7456_005127 [Penicillium angulare]|uniref:Uncharacterized protein n=1 Tax=Penicillium angulare TaxID=116970 RepID=A0A9W9KK93_9EURO|nr:hypothetical protein N7456_005127 [Penicillium angulare]